MTATDDPLVSTDWLAAHLDDAKVRVIDATFKLPGVLPLPVDDYLAALRAEYKRKRNFIKLLDRMRKL